MKNAKLLCCASVIVLWCVSVSVGDVVTFDQRGASATAYVLTRWADDGAIVWETSFGSTRQTLELGPDGYLYLGGWTTDRVYKIDPATGTVVGEVAVDTSVDRLNDFTFGPDYDGDGIADMYTSHLKTELIQVWSSGSGYTSGTDFATTGFDRYVNNLTFGPDLYGDDGVPDLWVIDGEHNDSANIMRILNGATGALEASWPLDFIRVPHDVEYGSDGRIYVTNSNRNQINSYLPDGSDPRHDGNGISRAGLRYPRQIHQGYDGKWYVSNRFAGDQSLEGYAVGSSNGAILVYSEDFTTFDSVFVEVEGSDLGSVIYLPRIASMQLPIDGAKVPTTLDTLSWVNPDPNYPGETMTCDVYISEQGDPNFMKYATIIVDDAAVESVNLSDLEPPIVLEYRQDYYWRVDTRDSAGTASGRVWKFTADNTPPQVDAGDDMYKWLTDGSVDIQMAPDVADDGKPLPPLLDVTWTLASGDADSVTIIEGLKEFATMRITATGEYVFRLEVWDGDEGLPPSFDTVAVNVFDDACAAAKAQPGYAPLVSDLDDDCDVDLVDLGILASEWLGSTALEE